MNKKMEEVVMRLDEVNKTISTMESCTGGGLVNLITNIKGASDVIKFSAITYSNEYKVRMGVNKSTIDKYTVYSKEVAREMAYNISNYTNSNYGVGITGKLMCQDDKNKDGDNNVVYYCIYDKDKNEYYDYDLRVFRNSRELNKEDVLTDIINNLSKIIS